MQGNHFLIPFHIPGTLTANITFVFTAPFDCQLIHAQAVGSNANNARIEIGTTADTDAYLPASDVGDSNVPAEFARASFTGGEYPHLPDGTVVEVLVDFDGASGTAVANLTVALTFSEG